MKKEAILSIIFILVNVIVMAFVIFISKGYKYDDKNGKLVKTGTLIVETFPTSSKVYLNSQDYGLTPLQINNLEQGQYDIRIFKDEYYSFETKVDVASNYVTKKYYTLISKTTQIDEVSSSNIINYTNSTTKNEMYLTAKSGSTYQLKYINFPLDNIFIPQDIREEILLNDINENLANSKMYLDTINNLIYFYNKDLLVFQTISLSDLAVKDLYKQTGLIPEEIYNDVLGNLFIKVDKNIYTYDTKNNVVYLKYVLKENESVQKDSYFFIKTKDYLYYSSKNIEFGNFIKVDLTSLSLENENYLAHLDATKRYITINTVNKIIVYDTILKNSYFKDTTSQFRDISERDDVLISENQSEIATINFLKREILVSKISISDINSLAVSSLRDLIIMFTNKGEILSSDLLARSIVNTNIPYKGEVISSWIDQNNTTYLLLKNNDTTKIFRLSSK